jgi:hypothetical protein
MVRFARDEYSHHLVWPSQRFSAKRALFLDIISVHTGCTKLIYLSAGSTSEARSSFWSRSLMSRNSR